MKRIGDADRGFGLGMKGFGGSGESAWLQALHTSEVRWDKVALLRNMIANGTYRVSSEAIAGKLMETMLCGG